MLGGDAERLIFPLKEVNAARCNRLVQFDRIDASKLGRAIEHFLWDEPNTKITAHNGKDLINGFNLNIRGKRQISA